jgi:nucleotide-binding universal stress UspA family protein
MAPARAADAPQEEPKQPTHVDPPEALAMCARLPRHPVTEVLAATDLQSDSRTVRAAAASLARATGARLHLIHVLTPSAVPRRVQAKDPDAVGEALEEASLGIERQAEDAREEGVDVASALVIRRRSRHQAILEQARACGADVIVLGSHARRSTTHRLGSTADRVLRTTSVPCLVIRGEVRFPIRRAAALTDFSPAARLGLAVAFSWLPGLGLADPKGRLDIVHVGWPQKGELHDWSERWTTRQLKSEVAGAKEQAQRAPTNVRPRLLWDALPVDAVVREARNEHDQLLVVATRGMGAVPRALLGSVTLGLLHDAPCSVLAVPPSRRRRG